MSSHWLKPLDKDQPIEFVTAYLRCLAPYARQDQDKTKTRRPRQEDQDKTAQNKTTQDTRQNKTRGVG